MKPTLSFRDAIVGRNSISVIAEIKRYSPSYGKDFPYHHSVAKLVEAYEAGGASAISVVTDGRLFKGSVRILQEARGLSKLPILRKDFITEIGQLEESAEMGTNAVLLIAGILEKEQLKMLVNFANSLGLNPVVEIHNEEEISKLHGLKNVIIGVNNRNLQTFHTDVSHAETLLEKIPAGIPIIVESGFAKAADFFPYQGKIDAVLIGTALLISANSQKTLINFTNAHCS